VDKVRGTTIKLTLVLGLTVGGAFALRWYDAYRSRDAEKERLAEDNRRLTEQKKQLETYIARLVSSRRVADVLVVDQEKKGPEVLYTDLLFIERDRDDKTLSPRLFRIAGDSAHIDYRVIKFDPQYVGKGDQLRGHALLMFHRLFGEHQKPAEAYRLDTPGEAPQQYRADPDAAEARRFERELWKHFWELAEDPESAAKQNVLVAQGQSVWGPFRPDYVYTIELSATGDVNRFPRPMDPVMREFRDAVRASKLAATGQ